MTTAKDIATLTGRITSLSPEQIMNIRRVSVSSDERTLKTLHDKLLDIERAEIADLQTTKHTLDKALTAYRAFKSRKNK